MKILVLLSGGVDSTTALAKAIEEVGKEQVLALSILYGQKHDRELESSIAVAKYYGVEHLYLDLAKIFEYSNCSLLKHSNGEIPHESYDLQINKMNGTPVSTYVPFRNGLFLSASASLAISKGCDTIYYGAHSDDACGNAYPDCSLEFTEYMNKAIYIGSGKQVHIEGPFVKMNKKDIVKEGLRLRVPYHLTWSCYEGHIKACGKCGTCIDRKNAFLANGMKDPIEYEE
ncbi:MAG: 7-cyano-7-deazaguanine synthase QueC [Anaeroplasmataceae bacterium]|nr:7-cyano-7-deazaguanine synthase QueC [Anaeroplasmataceae bacterium]